MVNQIQYIFTTALPIATKLGKAITCLNRFLPIKLHDPSITWLWEITWQPKTIAAPQCLWPPNLVNWRLAMRGFHAVCYFTLWWRGLARSRDKLKSFTTTYLYYHKIYDPKIRQDRDLHWLLFTHKAKWPYNHVVLWDHATN